MDGIEYKGNKDRSGLSRRRTIRFRSRRDSYFEYTLKDHLGNTRVRLAGKDYDGNLAYDLLEVEGQDGEPTLEYQEYLGANSYYPLGE